MILGKSTKINLLSWNTIEVESNSEIWGMHLLYYKLREAAISSYVMVYKLMDRAAVNIYIIIEM